MAEEAKNEEVETKTDAPEKEPKKEVKEEKEKAPKKVTKFYRSRLNGLTVILGNREAKDPNEVERVRFTTRVEMFQGDEVKVGYLASDDPRVHDRLKDDSNVVEITEKEYNAE